MRILIFIVLLLAPISVSAQLVITEIMYDLEGRDGGGEWVEVHNMGTETIALSEWRFVENDTNHRLSIHQGGELLAPGGYAIVADKPSRFLSDHAEYGGALFDSAFSLSNTGEVLAFRNEADMLVGEMQYQSGWGGAGNSYSLQLFNGEWIEAPPTPGAASAGPAVRDIAPEPVVTTQEPETAVLQHVIETNQEEDSSTVKAATQSANLQIGSEKTPLIVWIGALVALVVLGVILVLLARKEQEKEFTIIDDNENG